MDWVRANHAAEASRYRARVRAQAHGYPVPVWAALRPQGAPPAGTARPGPRMPPSPAVVARARRDRRIRAMVGRGITMRTVAMQVGVSVGTVHRVAHTMDDDLVPALLTRGSRLHSGWTR
jgi:hypothetical protein